MLVLALFARPLVVLLTLGLARLSWAERGVHRLERPEGRRADPARRVRRARAASPAPSKVYGLVFVVVLALGRGPGNARAVRRPGARDPDARAAGIAVGALGQARRGAASRARVRGRRQLARGGPRDPRASARRARAGSRSSCGTAPRPGPAARSSSRPAIACCSSPTPASSKRWRDSSTAHDSQTPKGGCRPPAGRTAGLSAMHEAPACNPLAGVPGRPIGCGDAKDGSNALRRSGPTGLRSFHPNEGGGARCRRSQRRARRRAGIMGRWSTGRTSSTATR